MSLVRNMLSGKKGVCRVFLEETGMDGLVHGLAFTNLYSGKESWGDKIMNKTMYLSGSVRNPVRFAFGMGLAAIVEIGFLAYGSYESAKGNWWYLEGNVVLKGLARLIDVESSAKSH